MSWFTTPRKSQHEAGMATFVVIIVFVVILSLIVIGFAQVSRRNSRESLDRQLASQAYYAAETGVNDAMNKIAQLVNAGQQIPAQDTCKSASADNSPNAPAYTRDAGDVITGNDSVQYTCLLVDASPAQLVYNNVDQHSVVVPIYGTQTDPSSPSGTAPDYIHSYKVQWDRDTASGASLGGCPAVGTNLKAAAWISSCPFGLLRIDFLPLAIGGTATIDNPLNAASHTMTMFIYPGNTPSATQTYDASTNNIYGSGAPQGITKEATCDSKTCELTIDGLDNVSSAYMRVTSLYRPTPSLEVDSSSTDTGFANAQVVIDVTAKAQDVLRRVRVHASISGGTGTNRSSTKGFSDFALESAESICKRYKTGPSPVVPGNFGGVSATACQ